MNVIIVYGTRKEKRFSVVNKALKAYESVHGLISLIIEGGAPGIDTLARKWAKLHGVNCITYWANWTGLGNDAGPLRNQRMIDDWIEVINAVICIPVPKSIGTWDCRRRAKKAKIRIFLWKKLLR